MAAKKKKQGLLQSAAKAFSNVKNATIEDWKQSAKSSSASAAKQTTAGNASQLASAKQTLGSIRDKFSQKTSQASKQTSQKSSASQVLSSIRDRFVQSAAQASRQASQRNSSGKWYAGDKPTQSETVARMYEIANGDEAKFRQMEEQYNQEINNVSSPIYNPYARATNTKAIDALTALGYDLSGGVTQKWLDDNRYLEQYGRTTTTSYGPAAPTKKSSDLQDAAYWYNVLQEDEERTVAAETEYKQLANTVQYLVDQGYSDSAILKKIRNDDFSGQYRTLAKMDEARLLGEATRLNRSVNYSGDDTINGMIWAARNGGVKDGEDYFLDSVYYAMGRGEKYRSNPRSEAARDPSNYEDYHPYYNGSNMDAINIATGASSYDNAWLNEHRWMLSGTEDEKKQWQKIADGVDNADKASAELASLDEWLNKQIERGYDADTIESKFEALLATSDYSALQKMERERERGGYVDLAYAVDFTKPRYLQKIRSSVAERDREANKANEAAEEHRIPILSDVADNLQNEFEGLKGRFEDAAGAYNDESIAEANHADVEDVEKARKAIAGGSSFMSGGVPNESYGATLQDAMKAYEAKANRDTAEAAAEAEAEAKRAKYMNNVLYTSVFGGGADEQNGTLGGELTPQAATGDTGSVEALGANGSGKMNPDSEEGQAFISMLEGGEWNASVYAWGVNNSNDRNAFRNEIVDGISDILRGVPKDEVNGLARSWWNAHAYLVDYNRKGYDEEREFNVLGSQVGRENYYGEAIGGAINSNTEAMKAGVITQDEYISNLMQIASVTDIVDGIAEQTDMRKDESAAEVFNTIPGQSAKIDAVQQRCTAALEADAAEQEANNQQMFDQSKAAVEAVNAGTPTMEQQLYVESVMAADVSSVARADDTYQSMLAYMDEALDIDMLAASDVLSLSGSGVDYESVSMTSAITYAQGVKAVAQAKLDRDMRLASACNMTLGEYYEAYPQQARSNEQLMGEAETEYKAAWGELGGTLAAAQEATAQAEQQISPQTDEPQAEGSEVAPDDSLSFRDTVALATDSAMNSLEEGVLKAWGLLTYKGMTAPEARARLYQRYNGDRAAYRADLEAWRDSLPEGSDERAEVDAWLDSDGDIFDIGMTMNEIKTESAIGERTANLQGVQTVVDRFGTEGDKFAFKVVSGVENSLALMGTTALGSATGLSPLAASVVAAVPEGGSAGYDLAEQGVDRNLALIAGAATTFVNGALESKMNVEYMPKTLQGKGSRALDWAKSELSKQGFAKLASGSPSAASKLLQAALYGAGNMLANAAGEGTQEAAQSLAGAIIENGVLNMSGLREGFILDASDLSEAMQEGIMGAITSVPLGAVGSAIDSYSPLSQPMVDYKGDILTMAEAQLLPEYEGTLVNEAIESATTKQAIHDAAADLGAIQSSAEYAAAEQAKSEVQEAMDAADKAQAKYAQLDAEMTAKQQAFAELNTQMLESDAFSEDMSKRMTALAEEILNASSPLNDAKAKATEALEKVFAVQAKLEAAEARVQAVYKSTMDAAKERARAVVIDSLFNGVEAQARAAEEAYLEKCGALAEAKAALRSAKADADLYRKGTVKGDEAIKAYGRALLEVEQLSAEAEDAKTAADEAYKNTPEAQAEQILTDSVSSAEQAAQEAEAAAQANPEDEQAQRLAVTARAEAQAAQAAQSMENVRKQTSEKLRSADSNVRKQGVQEYKAAVESAKAAQTAAEESRSAYESDYGVQGKLSRAIEDFQQYSEDDLLLDDSPNHEAAVDAYNTLMEATANAQVANARSRVQAARATMDSNNPASVQAYNDARTELASAVEQNVQYMRSTGWTDYAGRAKTGEQTTADRNPIEIMHSLTKSIGVAYNPGGNMRRKGSAVLGFYDNFARSITTNTRMAGDMVTGLHEFGHAVQAKMNQDADSKIHATQQMIDALPDSVKQTYTPAELDGEAMAEFAVAYMYDRDQAVALAGEAFVEDYEARLGEDKRLYAAVMDARAQVELWNNADVHSKIGAVMKEGQQPERRRIGNAIQRALRTIETEVFDFTAPAEMVSRDFRKRALYVMHASSRADVALTRFMISPQGRNIGKSFAERLYDAGATEANQKAASEFALARHALDRQREGKPVFAEDEISTADLQAYVADVEANHKDVVAVADAMVDFWADMFQAWWVNTGMVDQKTVDELRKKYPHYVPTYRVMGNNYKKYGGSGARFKMRAAVEGGSSLEVIDPFVSIVDQTQKLVRTVSQNQLMQAFHAEMQRGGLGEIAERVPEKLALTENDTSKLAEALDAIRDTGLIDDEMMDDAYSEMLALQQRWTATGQGGRNTVGGIDQRGNRFFYEIKPGAEDLYGLLSGMSNRPIQMGRVLNSVRKFNRMFTSLTTSRNPLFALKNFARDFQASVNTGTYALTYADGMVKWLKAFQEVLTENKNFLKWTALGGGEHTRLNTEVNSKTANAVTKDLAKDLLRGKRNRHGDFELRTSVLEKISGVLTLERFNEIVENTSRYVEYRFGKHNKSTNAGRIEAFMASQDVTTNFGTHGANSVLRGITSFVPFANATLQGVEKDYTLLKDVFTGTETERRAALPKVGKTLLNVGLTAALQYALLRLHGGDDDDEDYAILSQEMRTGNLVIPMPKSIRDGLSSAIGFDKPFIRIPMEQGMFAQSIYSVALDAMANIADYSPMEVDLFEAAKSILTDQIPDGSIFSALSDTLDNRTWYGGTIENAAMQRYSSINRYDSDTPQAFIWLGDKLNVSPAKLEYLTNQYSGYAGKIIMPLISSDRLYNSNGWSADGAARNLVYSVLSNYTIDPVSSNDLSSRYYTSKDVISEIIADGKAGKPIGSIARNADGNEAYEAAIALNEELSALDREISEHWTDYEEVQASTNLTRSEKSTQMRNIRRNYINPLMQDGIALYEEYKMRYIDCDTLAKSVAASLEGKRPIAD